MSFFDKDEIAKLTAERQREEDEAARAAQKKKAAEDEAKALALREAGALLPHVLEALDEFPGLAEQLGKKPWTCSVYVDALFGQKTKYGRKKVETDVALWHLFSGRWPSGYGTVAIDSRGRTFLEELDERTKETYIAYDRYEVSRETAAGVIAASIRNGFYDKNKAFPKGSLLDAARAKQAVQDAFMEILKTK